MPKNPFRRLLRGICRPSDVLDDVSMGSDATSRARYSILNDATDNQDQSVNMDVHSNDNNARTLPLSNTFTPRTIPRPDDNVMVAQEFTNMTKLTPHARTISSNNNNGIISPSPSHDLQSTQNGITRTVSRDDSKPIMMPKNDTGAPPSHDDVESFPGSLVPQDTNHDSATSDVQNPILSFFGNASPLQNFFPSNGPAPNQEEEKKEDPSDYELDNHTKEGSDSPDCTLDLSPGEQSPRPRPPPVDRDISPIDAELQIKLTSSSCLYYECADNTELFNHQAPQENLAESSSMDNQCTQSEEQNEEDFATRDIAAVGSSRRMLVLPICFIVLLLGAGVSYWGNLHPSLPLSSLLHPHTMLDSMSNNNNATKSILNLSALSHGIISERLFEGQALTNVVDLNANKGHHQRISTKNDLFLTPFLVRDDNVSCLATEEQSFFVPKKAEEEETVVAVDDEKADEDSLEQTQEDNYTTNIVHQEEQQEQVSRAVARIVTQVGVYDDDTVLDEVNEIIIDLDLEAQEKVTEEEDILVEEDTAPEEQDVNIVTLERLLENRSETDIESGIDAEDDARKQEQSEAQLVNDSDGSSHLGKEDTTPAQELSTGDCPKGDHGEDPATNMTAAFPFHFIDGCRSPYLIPASIEDHGKFQQEEEGEGDSEAGVEVEGRNVVSDVDDLVFERSNTCVTEEDNEPSGILAAEDKQKPSGDGEDELDLVPVGSDEETNLTMKAKKITPEEEQRTAPEDLRVDDLTARTGPAADHVSDAEPENQTLWESREFAQIASVLLFLATVSTLVAIFGSTPNNNLENIPHDIEEDKGEGQEIKLTRKERRKLKKKERKRIQRRLHKHTVKAE